MTHDVMIDFLSKFIDINGSVKTDEAIVKEFPDGIVDWTPMVKTLRLMVKSNGM